MAKYSYWAVEKSSCHAVMKDDLQIGYTDTRDTAKLIVDALNAYTPPVEPVPCVCGEVPVVCGGQRVSIFCSRAGCWGGPAKLTREEAIEAWNQVMGK